MTNTIAQVIAYARAHPTNNGGSWHNWCEAFVYRAGNFGQSFGTAQMAGDASGPLNRSYAAAPAGAIHYWAGGGVGHVGFELGGGLVLMASDGVTALWGTAMGTATVPAYNARKRSMAYRGWSLRHGMQTLNLTSATASSSTPIASTPIIGATDMSNTYYYQNGAPGVIEWGIFGPEVDGGVRTTTNIAVARAWGKLYGTHATNADGGPQSIGAPWEVLSKENWDNLKVVSAQARRDYIAAQASVDVSSVNIGALELAPATIAALAQANAAAFFADAAKRLAQ